MALVENIKVNAFDVQYNSTNVAEALAQGWTVVYNDAEFQQALVTGGSIAVAYTPVTLEGIFVIGGHVQIKPLLAEVLVDTRQLWLRSPRTFNTSTNEFDYTAYDVRIFGNFRFDFTRQDASFSPGVGLAVQSAGTLSLEGIEATGGWVSNITLDYGNITSVRNVYTHDCGRGKVQAPDGSNRNGMGIVITNPTNLFMHDVRAARTWASSIFLDSTRPNRTVQVQMSDIYVNTSGGNGVRLQSNDMVNGTGQGTAITRVNLSNLNIKNCESHGLRGNFRTGVVTGVVIESCNAGIAIEGSGNVSYDNCLIKDCAQGLIYRFYPVENSRVRFSNFQIINPTDVGVFLQANSSNSTVNLGEIEFDGLSVHVLSSGARSIEINGGAASPLITDLVMRNVRIVGAYPGTNSYYVDLQNLRHVDIDGISMRGFNGTAEAYIRASASQSICINRAVAVQPFGTVNRPIAVSGSAGLVNISNCVIPATTVTSIGYAATPAQRYEHGNQFSVSSQPQGYSFTGAGELRGGAVSTMTTTQIANTLATLIRDLEQNKFVVRS